MEQEYCLLLPPPAVTCPLASSTTIFCKMYQLSLDFFLCKKFIRRLLFQQDYFYFLQCLERTVTFSLSIKNYFNDFQSSTLTDQEVIFYDKIHTTNALCL